MITTTLLDFLKVCQSEKPLVAHDSVYGLRWYDFTEGAADTPIRVIGDGKQPVAYRPMAIEGLGTVIQVDCRQQTIHALHCSLTSLLPPLDTGDATLDIALGTIMNSGGLVCRQNIIDTTRSILKANSKLAKSITSIVDTNQCGLTDVGIYDLKDIRKLSLTPQVYIPLRTRHFWPTWLILSWSDIGPSYHFGMRLGPNTELLEIKESCIDESKLTDLLDYISICPPLK